MHIHRTCPYLYIVLEKEEDVSASKREDDVSIWKREDNVSSWKREEGVSTWKREVHVSIWKRDEIVQTKCKRSQSTVPNLLSSHHWQKANNQIHCTRSAHITSLTKSKQPNPLYQICSHNITDKKQTTKTTVPDLITSHHWQKANNQNYYTKSAYITSLTKNKQSQTTVRNLLTSHHWQKNNDPQIFFQNYNSYLYVYLQHWLGAPWNCCRLGVFSVYTIQPCAVSPNAKPHT